MWTVGCNDCFRCKLIGVFWAKGHFMGVRTHDSVVITFGAFEHSRTFSTIFQTIWWASTIIIGVHITNRKRKNRKSLSLLLFASLALICQIMVASFVCCHYIPVCGFDVAHSHDEPFNAKKVSVLLFMICKRCTRFAFMSDTKRCVRTTAEATTTTTSTLHIDDIWQKWKISSIVWVCRLSV